MKKLKEKQPVDLLALPQKERVHLCKEIRNILQQRVTEEKNLQRENNTETQQPYRSRKIPTQTSESYFTKIKTQISNRLA